MWVKANYRILTFAFIIFFQLLIIGTVALFQVGRVAIDRLLSLQIDSLSFELLLKIMTIIIATIFCVNILQKNEKISRIISYAFCIWFSGFGILFLFHHPTDPNVLSFFLIFASILVLCIIITVARILRRTKILYLSENKSSNEIYWTIHDILKRNGIEYKLRGTDMTLDFKVQLNSKHLSNIRFHPVEYQDPTEKKIPRLEYIILTQSQDISHSRIKEILNNSLK